MSTYMRREVVVLTSFSQYLWQDSHSDIEDDITEVAFFSRRNDFVVLLGTRFVEVNLLVKSNCILSICWI